MDNVAKQKEVKDGKKVTVAFLKDEVEALDRSVAEHFTKGNFALAAQDAKKMSVFLQILSEIDLTK